MASINRRPAKKPRFGETTNDWNAFISIRNGAQHQIAFDVAYVDMLDGDHLTALLLSQIMYWHLPDREGYSRLRVFKNGFYWLVKKRTDWLNETRMTDKQVRRSLAILKKKGWIKTTVHRFNNIPTTHIRIVTETFLPAYFEAVSRLILPQGAKTEVALEGQNINRDYVTETDKGKGRSDEQLPPLGTHLSSLGETLLDLTQSNRKQKAIVTKRLANIELIQYFLKKWEEEFGESHTRLGSATLQKADHVFSEAQVNEQMIDRYFEKKYQKGCDYRILHFCSEGVIQNLIYETQF